MEQTIEQKTKEHEIEIKRTIEKIEAEMKRFAANNSSHDEDILYHLEYALKQIYLEFRNY